VARKGIEPLFLVEILASNFYLGKIKYFYFKSIVHLIHFNITNPSKSVLPADTTRRFKSFLAYDTFAKGLIHSTLNTLLQYHSIID